MSGRDVIDVQRKGAEAHHFVHIASDELADSLFTTGEAVNCAVDWTRRFDHMQQHSGDLLHSIQHSPIENSQLQ